MLTATWLLPVALIPGTWDDDVLRAPTPPPKDDNKPSESGGPDKANTNERPAKDRSRSAKDDKKPFKDSPKKSGR